MVSWRNGFFFFFTDYPQPIAANITLTLHFHKSHRNHRGDMGFPMGEILIFMTKGRGVMENNTLAVVK